MTSAKTPAGPGAHDRVLRVRAIGSLHVGGRTVSLDGLEDRHIVFSPGNPPIRVNPNGAFEIEQMYVQYVRLAAPLARQPLLLMHGGGLCGVTWETTPDGRPGWQSHFLHAGHDVFVADAVERGRASWARSPEFFQGEPMFRTKAEAWELFRIGPDGSWHGDCASSVANPGAQFPVAAFDQFMKQTMPRWLSTEAASQAAYNTLALEHGPFAIIAHSQGGNFAAAMALAHPDQVRCIVSIEPSGFPDPASHDLRRIAHIPQLFLWGDHRQHSANWGRILRGLRGYIDKLRSAGVRITEFDLPAMGILGNSHMLMMDRNSDQVAGLVQGWMDRQGLMRR